MPRSPAVRAGAVRDHLELLDRHHPGARRALLDTIPADARETLEGAPRTTWLPIEVAHHSVDGTCALLGEERALELWRRTLPEHLAKPILRPLASGMLRLLSGNPGRLLSLVPAAFERIYKDMAVPSAEPLGEAGVRLRFDELAPEIGRYRGYLVSWHGLVAGFGATLRPDMRCDHSLLPGGRGFALDFRWG